MDAAAEPSEAVLVCGLGQLGAACVRALVGYGVPVLGLDLAPREVAELSGATVGEFRDPEVLRRAGIERCRSVLFMAADEAVNMKGALAARYLCPNIRIVVRAHEQQYPRLTRHLGNFVVYAPSHLAAPSLGLAAIDSEVVAHFSVRGRLFQVLEHAVKDDDPRIGRLLGALGDEQVLLHVPAQRWTFPDAWFKRRKVDPDMEVHAGDRLFLLTTSTRTEVGAAVESAHGSEVSRWQRVRQMLRAFGARFGVPRTQAGRVALGGLSAVAVTTAISTLLFTRSAQRVELVESMRASLLLLLAGGHLADVFDAIEGLDPLLLWGEILVSVAGTVLTAVLYALLTQRLLAAHFNILARKPKVPAHGHVVIAGYGRSGQETARFLRKLERPLVVLDQGISEAALPQDVPLVRGNALASDQLRRVHLESAGGFVAAIGEDLGNVELALLARSINPRCELVVRLFDARLVESVRALLPNASVLCMSSLAAAAFAAAALGERVINVFHLGSTPVLVTEYVVEPEDAMHGSMVAEIAEGYDVVLLLLERSDTRERQWSPEESHYRLQRGDKLVLLATPASLEAIERGEAQERSHTLRIERVLPFAAELELAGVLSRNLGLSLSEARRLIKEAPTPLPTKLYPRHAERTRRALEQSGARVTTVRAGHEHAP